MAGEYNTYGSDGGYRGYGDGNRNQDRGGGGGGGGGRGRGRGRGRGDGPRSRRPGIPLSALDANLTGFSHKVIGIATEIHTVLGPGYEEATYLEALKNEMTAQGIRFKQNHSFDVKYKERIVGTTTVDFLIEDQFLVSIVSRPGEIGGGERATLRAQLKAADLVLGLVVSFGGRRLKDGLVRVLNVEKLKRERPGEFDQHMEEGEEHSEAPGGEWDDSAPGESFGDGRSVNFDDRS
jgi:hypothetical protein